MVAENTDVVSIPHGTIKSPFSFFTVISMSVVSIPHGTIKSLKKQLGTLIWYCFNSTWYD